MSETTTSDSIWTVPNAVTGLRLVGLVPLLWVAAAGHRTAFVWVLVFLFLSDWADGKLGALLDQATDLGARLDSMADALMYASIALSFWWLERSVILEELEWFLAVLATWSLSAVVGLIRFRKLPSYHTWGAKVSWLVATVVTLVWAGTGDARGVVPALALVVLTNLEATAIGLILPEWRANVSTLAHAIRIRRVERGGDPEG